MGVVKNIDRYNFPKQSDRVGKETIVCFHYDSENTIKGTLVREDLEAPFVTIFRLEDGRHVLATECQYKPIL